MRRTAASSSPAACASSCRASRSIVANAGLSPRKRAHRSDRRAVRSARISASSLNAAFFVIPENGESAQSARSARSQRSTSVAAISPYPWIWETPPARPSSRKRRSEQMALPNAVSTKRRCPRSATARPWRTSAGATRPNSAAGSFAATTTAAACAPADRPSQQPSEPPETSPSPEATSAPAGGTAVEAEATEPAPSPKASRTISANSAGHAYCPEGNAKRTRTPLGARTGPWPPKAARTSTSIHGQAEKNAS